MRDLELRVRQECLMQDFVKNLVRLLDVLYGIAYA